MRMLLTTASVFLVASLSYGGPGKGAQAAFVNIAADPWQGTLRFKAGERASVFAKGNLGNEGNDALGSLRIEIYDAGGQLIASSHDTFGYAVVFWYPPRSADYRILIHNNSGQEKRLYICIK